MSIICSGIAVLILSATAIAVAQPKLEPAPITPPYVSYREARGLIDAHVAAGIHKGAVSWPEALYVVSLLLSVVGGLTLLIYRAGVARLDDMSKRTEGVEVGLVALQASVSEMRGEWTIEARHWRDTMARAQECVRDEVAVARAALDEARRLRGEPPYSAAGSGGSSGGG